jgi:small subunit ribosomal protein S4e
MDVVEIKSSDERFRLLPKRRGGFRLVEISEKEKSVKLCRVESKTMIPGGKLQIALHDGRNILLPEGAKPSDYKPLDTLKISIPDQKIISSISLDNGAYTIVTQGKNVGIEGKIIAIERRLGPHASTVTLEDPDGNRVQTSLEYVFVVGAKKSEVSLSSAGGSE